MEKAGYIDLGFFQWPTSTYGLNPFPLVNQSLIVMILVFASGTFIPAIPQIAHDLATSPEIVTYVETRCLAVC